MSESTSGAAAAAAALSDSPSAPAPAPPPHLQIIQMATAPVLTKALYVFAELGLADLLKDGPLTADALAPTVGAQAGPLYRLLRTMAGVGYVVEDADHRFALTPVGEALQSDSPTYSRSMVRILAGPLGWNTLGDLHHSVKTGDAAFLKAYGQPIFDYLAAAPQDAAMFNELMIAFHGGEPPAVAAAYDFSGLETIVDVGGGTGNLLTTILLANPGARGVLHDMAHVTAEARKLIASRGLSDRCTTSDGSFFDALPSGGDAYILSHILHDWDEASCLQILNVCKRGMKPTSRLLVVEMVIPEGNEFHPSKLTDMVMLAFTPGGCERSAAEYAQLFAKAGLKLTRVVPTASPVSVVEAVLAD